MANDEPEFIRNFNASLTRLGEINAAIETNTKQKTDFNTFVSTRLGRLRVRIDEILVQIRGIRVQLDNLQGNVAQNNDAIRIGEERIADLNRDLEAARGERDALRGELDAANGNNANLQQQLNELQQNNVALTDERNALQRELAEGGDAQRQHEEAIAALQQQHDRQINEIQAQNAQQAQELQQLQQQIDARQAELQANADRIANLEGQLNDVNNQLQANVQRIAELEQRQQENEQQITQLERQLADANNQLQGNGNLQQQIQDLTEQNQRLEEANRSYIDRIIAATNAINNAMDSLGQLTDETFYNNNQNQINDMLVAIENSLQEISNAIAGNLANNVAPAAQLPPQRPQRQQGPEEPNREFIINNGPRLNLNDLMNNLQARSLNEPDPENNKFGTAYRYINRQISSRPNMSERVLGQLVMTTLRNNNIELRANGTIGGGYSKKFNKTKKTKKYRKPKKTHTRKQKGGFLYGKYKKTTTSKSNKSTSSINSTSPSTNSTTNTKTNTNTKNASKKHKKNVGKGKGRGLTKNRRT
jgi:hypothetical protein